MHTRTKLALPPHAITRARLGTAARTLQGMQPQTTRMMTPTAEPVVIVKTDKIELERLRSALMAAEDELARQRRSADRAEAAAVGASLHAAKHQATARQHAARQMHVERLGHVQDNTLRDAEPEMLITSDAARARLSLDARAAVVMRQPTLNAPLRLWRGLMRVIWG